MTGEFRREVDLPPGIWRVVEEAVERLDPERVVLYGSRARGTNRKGSDWDLAFDGRFDEREWTRFWVDMIEDGPTLLPMDLARLEDAQPRLRANIERDGRLLYARH